jgi:hypothetical protein
VFTAGARIAQHFSRRSTPNDQDWIESFFEHLKGEFPHREKIKDPASSNSKWTGCGRTTTPSGSTRASLVSLVDEA